MTNSDETRRVVRAYFDAWTRNDVATAYAQLADDLHFAGPSARYETREAFKGPLTGFAAMTKRASIVELLVDGDRAAMLYDCELPAPVGTLRIASFFRVASGKIAWYETQFDATEFGKLLPKKP